MSGLPTYVPTGPENRTYRIACTLKSTTPDSVQGKAVSATLQWETRSVP